MMCPTKNFSRTKNLMPGGAQKTKRIYTFNFKFFLIMFEFVDEMSYNV